MWTRRLVDLLVEASGDNEPSAEDVGLAEQVEGWLMSQGWDTSPAFGFRKNADNLMFYVDLDDDFGLRVVRREHGYWKTPGDTYRVRTFRQALNQLAALEIIPARFSTFGRDALRDYAEVCDRAADLLETRGANQGDAAYEEAAAKAEGLRQAAVSARQMYPLRVAA